MWAPKLNAVITDSLDRKICQARARPPRLLPGVSLLRLFFACAVAGWLPKGASVETRSLSYFFSSCLSARMVKGVVSAAPRSHSESSSLLTHMQVGLTRLLCECPRAWTFACWPAAMDAVCKSVRDSRVPPPPPPPHPSAASESAAAANAVDLVTGGERGR